MVDAKRIELANEFIKALQEGDEAHSDDLLSILAADRESRLFEEIGKLTRQLHNTINSVEIESELAGLAESYIPDAKERLNFVIEKTEDSANRTMDAVDEIMPVSETIRSRAGQLHEDWSRFQRREMDINEFKIMGGELVNFLTVLERDSETIYTGLNNILMAQDFQDSTGQVIRKVIQLVQDVEDSLVGMIRTTGVQVTPKKKVEEVAAEGPQINLEEKNNVVNSQDEVDDLLSSLGF